MASILKRTVILSFSRFANQAILLLSPLLLVRILTVGEYGAYREFLLYAGLIAPLVSFGVARALPYLLPKYPEKETVWVTQTSIFILAFCIVAITGVFVAGDLIRANTSYDFVTELQLYIFFLINLDFIELYWLGKKRTDLVFFYSTGRLLARTVVVVTAAYLTKDALQVVQSLIVLEAVRCFLVLLYALYRRWFTRGFTRKSLALQMSYFMPLGTGAVIETLNANVGMLFISAILGPKALAFYAIGEFATRIVDILRGAVADVIFPDIVQMKTATPKEALPLWRRATVWYCVMLFPATVLFSYYADVIVTVLFTTEYSAAVPVFATYAIAMLVFCFDFHLPLRVQNKNRYFLVGSIVALVTNIALVYPMYLLLGFIGPAVAIVLSRLAMAIYLASGAMAVYNISVAELAIWSDIGKVLTASVVCAPILVAGKFLIEPAFLRGLIFGIAYLVAYLATLRAFGVWDALTFFRTLCGSLLARRRASHRGG